MTGLPNSHYYRLNPNYHYEDETDAETEKKCPKCDASLRIEGPGWIKCPQCGIGLFAFMRNPAKYSTQPQELILMVY